MPLEIAGSQYEPLKWADIPGWAEDDQQAAFETFLASCKPIVARREPPKEPKALGSSLSEPCRAARAAHVRSSDEARAFFERHFVPLRISRLGETEGLVTGYYEPVLEGSRTYSEQFPVPVYRRPSNLFVRGVRSSTASLPNKGDVFRKIGRRKLVPYYDRAEIEDGILSGRGLEICYVKNFTELLFMQIQGSARIKLEDGSVIRINYDSHNGQAYTPVGRILIERNIIAREDMSMQRIRDYMASNPDLAKELRRQNKAYVFFREVQLSDKDEAIGAQGIPLTAGRSIAVDRLLHVYGTPFFIEAKLPIESERSQTPFRRLMVSQDTGSAIVGPARADIYFGAGAEAGRISGRLKHGARFIMLVPKGLDPVAAGKRMILPDARPSAKIAKLFPPAKDAPKEGPSEAPKNTQPKGDNKQTPVADSKDGTVATDAAPAAVPLPQARPDGPPPRRKTFRRYLR
ncbi:MltA domain-containing protein [Bradyrhizobium sp. LHD-71]|uniref:murein transglycosylase A n=1 Tax=Bradyrhizobium sp. LHD-71 TaxID=3072141 RepID=UPI00280E7AC5|nr:MltA domain-containing protein [Bradyrhizobium sp. LHD-71]MDQ8732652.1 MltA domain-containing protein [Bradyrhizobium sp. LHD-71]